MIPSILHYVWIPTSPDDLPGPLLRACREQTERLHPGWQVMDWSDAELLDHEALKTARPLLVKAWEKFAGERNARSDLLRLASVYIYGGVYLDWDVWPIRSLDVFRGKDILLSCNSFQPLIVGEHVIGAPPLSDKILKVIRHFCRVPPNEGGIYSPNLAKFAWYYGWELQFPDTFCPHQRASESEFLYRTTPLTHAIHCWSPLGYDVERLKSL